MTEEEVDQLRRTAHEIPMNAIGMDHKGRRFLLSHSMAWAKASREWMEASKILERQKSD